MSVGRRVVMWGAIGALMTPGGFLLLLFVSMVRLDVGLGLPTFFFPAWPLLQLTGGDGLSRLAIPVLCLSSNVALYAGIAYLWYGLGVSRPAVRAAVRIGIVLWFGYSVVWAAVDWQLALRS